MKKHRLYFYAEEIAHYILRMKNLVTQIVCSDLVSTIIFLSNADIIHLSIMDKYYVKYSHHLIFTVTHFYTHCYHHMSRCVVTNCVLTVFIVNATAGA